MFELLLALSAETPVQSAPVPAQAPRTAQAGELTVSDGSMMAWMSRDGLGGDVKARIENAGAGSDRILSISTPAGTVGKVSLYTIVNGRGTRAPDGELSIPPGGTGIVAELTDIASGQAAASLTTITLVFERAGEITIRAVPTSPAPPSARP